MSLSPRQLAISKVLFGVRGDRDVSDKEEHKVEEKAKGWGQELWLPTLSFAPIKVKLLVSL